MRANSEYVINSLVNQNANMALMIAERDAVLAELKTELEELRKEQIKEMDEDAE